MILTIYVNSNGTHSWAGFFHDIDWKNKEYRKEVDDAVLKTFRKLKLKNIHPVTITEVTDVEPRTGQTKQIGKAQSNALQPRPKGRLAERKALIQSVADAYKLGD